MATSPLALRLDPVDTGFGSLGASRTKLIGLAVLLLLIGSVGGWAVGRRGTEATQQTLDQTLRTSTLIGGAPAEVRGAAATPEGAVQAATGFMVYYSNILDDPN